MPRSPSHTSCLLAALILTTWAQVFGAPPKTVPQRQNDLKKMLAIGYQRGPDMPQGFQDSAGGFLGDVLVTAGGFQWDGDKGTRPEKYPFGLLNKAWAIDLSRAKPQWSRLPDFPGEPRQGLFCAVVGDAMYFWGGFRYNAPGCYKDGFRLRRDDGDWLWSKMPDLPWMLTFSGTCAIGSRIYVLGGHDYEADPPDMHTITDRTGRIKRLGARMLMIDTADPEATWTELSPCPGTPRAAVALAAINGKIYAIGGDAGALKAQKAICGDPSFNPDGVNICSVVDNWMYDPATDRWTRLRDLPVSSGAFPTGAVVYKNRYILLVGGFQWGNVLDPDLKIRPDYGKAKADPNHLHTKYGGWDHYYSDVFVYDTRTNLFGIADPLPMNNFMPMAVVRGNTLHLLGGETGGSKHTDGAGGWIYYAHHADLYLRGTIEELDWQ